MGANTPANTRSLINASAFLTVFTLFVILVWGVFYCTSLCFLILFVLITYVPVNSFTHVETARSHILTVSLASLTKKLMPLFHPPIHQESINIRSREDLYFFQFIRDFLRFSYEAGKKHLKYSRDSAGFGLSHNVTVPNVLQCAITYLELLQ